MFNSSQLFRELLWENMPHILYRCKIIIRIDCAYLERMKINLNATFGALREPILNFTPLHTILVHQKKRSYINTPCVWGEN